MLKIALFGTSADPPTLGHQQILSWLAQAYDQVVVWAADNPFKAHGASLDQRTAMLQLLIQDLQISSANVLLRPSWSSRYTLETLQKAQAAWPGQAFTLVVGSDLISQLPTWYQAAELLAQVDILIIPRPHYAIQSPDLVQVESMARSVAIANIQGLDVSSTAYREHRASQGLPPAIAEYIEQEQLYR